MKIFRFLLIAVAALTGVACSDDNKNDNGNEPAPSPKNVELKVSTDYMVANGIDEVTFTVLADGVDATQTATIYDKENKKVHDAKFSTTTPGSYKFWAVVGTTYSKEVTITAIEQQVPELPADPQPESTDFVQRTLITQYTGTACGFCPTMIEALDQLAADETYGNKFLLGACHDYNFDDPMYHGNTSIATALPHNGWPYVVVGFTEGFSNSGLKGNVTNLKKAIDKCFNTKVKAGLAVNAELTGNTLIVNTELKAATDGNYTIGCWVLEDGIEAYQNGSKGNMIHNNVIRTDCKPYFGNSVGSVNAGKTANTLFTFTLKESWVKENCHVIVFACYSQGSAHIITNAIAAPLNSAVPYEYNN